MIREICVGGVSRDRNRSRMNMSSVNQYKARWLLQGKNIIVCAQSKIFKGPPPNAQLLHVMF